MPCLLVLIAVVFPRVCLVLTWLLSTVLQRAYHDMIVPIIGFIFLPLTTLVYAYMVYYRLPVEGPNLVILVIAVLVDAGGHGGGANYYRSRR